MPSDLMAANRRLTGWLLLSAAGVLSAPHAVAQELADTATVTVTGNIVNAATGEPIPGVVIVVEALDISFLTDTEGKFLLADVPRGMYSLHLIHWDYQRLDGDLTIDRPGEFVLSMTPIEDPNEGMITGIVGVVTDQVTGDPISEVVVNVPGVGRATTTNADGRFRLPDLFPGRHEVAFSHLGYRQRSETLDVQAGHATRVQVVLTIDAIALDPIEVAVDRRDRNLENAGFYQREEAGWGHFVDRDDIENWNPLRITDALMRAPGVTTVMDPRMPSRQYLAFRKGGATCFPAVYLDGIRIGSGRGPAEINDILNPVVVAGIEVYRRLGGMPPQYSGLGSDCGVVLIWLRRGG
ncbi:MAG: carboxypeptidase regulatory-like domain-containing protein [Gemmatimonadota bacterium]|nr:carboxypeptidase regulatory-like domain-containing protein [Gemmatimonadota bacterium]